MIYNTINNDKLSLLGFGAMRLPTKENGNIDEEKNKRNGTLCPNTWC